MKKVSYKFKGPEEILEFIQKEVMKYTGCFSLSQVLYSYNRLTVEELAMEVYLKLLRSVNDKQLNKAYVRQAVVFVCIDEYRRYRLVDPKPVLYDGEEEGDDSYCDRQLNLEADETYNFELTERLMNLKLFEPKELEVVLLLMEGKRNPEIRKELDIPKMTYYTLLSRLRRKYIELFEEELEELNIL